MTPLNYLLSNHNISAKYCILLLFYWKSYITPYISWLYLWTESVTPKHLHSKLSCVSWSRALSWSDNTSSHPDHVSNCFKYLILMLLSIVRISVDYLKWDLCICNVWTLKLVFPPPEIQLCVNMRFSLAETSCDFSNSSSCYCCLHWNSLLRCYRDCFSIPAYLITKNIVHHTSDIAVFRQINITTSGHFNLPIKGSHRSIILSFEGN